MNAKPPSIANATLTAEIIPSGLVDSVVVELLRYQRDGEETDEDVAIRIINVVRSECQK